MENSLEQEFEILIQQLKSRQYNGELKQPIQPGSVSEELTKLVKEFHLADKSLLRQKDELLFAYQTLEVGYQRYWELFQYAPDGYLVTDTEGIIQEANQTILSMLSETQKELTGKPITKLIPELQPRDFGLQLNWFSGSQIMEVRLYPRGRTPYFVSISIAPQYNLQNRADGLLWLIRDITAHKNIEEDLRKSHAELNLLLNKIPCILLITDQELKITSVSGTGLNTIHMRPEDIIGRNLVAILPPKYQDNLEMIQNALSGITQTIEFEWKDFTFQYIIEPLKDIKGESAGLIGVAFDITERIKAENLLRKSHLFNARLLQNSPNPISVVNADTSIAYVNPAFEKLTGFSARTMIGQKSPYPWWIKDRAKTLESRRLNFNRKKEKQENLYRKKNGDQFWVEATTVQIEGGDESYCYLETWVDITESRRLRENLEFYVRQVTWSQEEERKRIAQELHEEILQSLISLRLAVEIIIKPNEQGTTYELKDLEGLKDKTNGVIEEVRRFSYGLRPGVFDYLGLTAALETLTDELSKKGIKTSLTMAGKERPLFPDMEITIFRIVQEALSNIIKYSLATKVNVNLSYTGAKLKLVIEDNGQGFSLPCSLRELANQGKLGLIGMEERTRLYGGNFTIRTQPKKGTAIIVTLPVSVKSK
jgi:PAS domain S-box-containing protein